MWIQQNVFPPIWIDSASVRFMAWREPTSMASVFSSFSLSLLLSIQAFIDRKQDSKSDTKHWNSVSWDALCSCVSSANFWQLMLCSLILSETGWECRVKRMGPRTEPWGTPYFKGKGKEFKSPTETDCVLLVR